MLRINSISKGIVIDHIRAGLGIRIFSLLKLENANFPVALIMNVPSKRCGRKDMIKIENEIDIDLNPLSLLDENITINVIDNEEIQEKRTLVLPEKITSLLECNNPRCICSVEQNLQQSLSLVDRERGIYQCDYCEHLYDAGKLCR